MTVNKQLTGSFIFPTWLMIILGLLIAAGILAIIFVFFKDVIIAVFSKQVTTQATLSSKYDHEFLSKTVYAAGGGGGVASGVAEKRTEYFFCFQLDNGRFITFTVPKDIYDVALEDSTGSLTYKGKRFISYDGPTIGTRVRQDTNSTTFVGLDKTL